MKKKIMFPKPFYYGTILLTTYLFRIFISCLLYIVIFMTDLLLTIKLLESRITLCYFSLSNLLQYFVSNSCSNTLCILYWTEMVQDFFKLFSTRLFSVIFIYYILWLFCFLLHNHINYGFFELRRNNQDVHTWIHC